MPERESLLVPSSDGNPLPLPPCRAIAQTNTRPIPARPPSSTARVPRSRPGRQDDPDRFPTPTGSCPPVTSLCQRRFVFRLPYANAVVASSFLTPKALCPPAQGCRAAATLGTPANTNNPTLKGLCPSLPTGPCYTENPFQRQHTRDNPPHHRNITHPSSKTPVPPPSSASALDSSTRQQRPMPSHRGRHTSECIGRATGRPSRCAYQ